MAAEADHPNVTAAGAANATAAGRPGAGPGVVTARHPFAETAGMFFRNYSAVAGLAVIVVIVAGALAGPYLYPTDPFEMVWSPLSGPGEAGFLLGTDYLGRDLLAGIVHGGRVTLAIGLSATVVIGITVGALSGYYGGWVEEALMRHRLRGRRRR